MQTSHERSLHDAIKAEAIDRVEELVIAAPITSETINLVIQTKNSDIAQIFVNAIQGNKNARENFSNILKEPSTKELINQAISINDFNFSYLALTLLDPPMKRELLSRIDAFKYQNNQILFSPSLIKLNKHNILTSDNVEALTLYMNNYDLKITCSDIADCFIRLHQADLLNEVNRQLIINNPTLHITLVNALIKLKESDLVSDDITHQAIINKPYAYEEIITGLIQLKEANLLNLLSDDNRRAFLNNPDQHQEIINGLKELREVPDLFSVDSNRQAIINNPSHYKGIIAGLIELKAANLLTEDNRQLIIHNVVASNPYYNCKNLIDDLRKLDEAKILSADTGELLKRGQSKYMVEAIVNLHNEKILDTFTSLLPTLTRSGILSVAKGLFILKQADILTEQSQNLILENQEDAVEISLGLVSLKEHGFLNDDIVQLLSEKTNIREITGYLSSLIEEKTLNAENIKQFITCYDDLMRFKDKVLTEENYNLLIQQNDLKLAVNGLNKLLYSGCGYDNLQEYIVNCTRPGFAEMFDLLQDTGLLTKENIHKLIQLKDIDLIKNEIESLAEKGILTRENVKEYIINSLLFSSEPIVDAQITDTDSLKTSLHEAIQVEAIDRIEELVIAAPITSETINLVIQTKNSDIAQIFFKAIQENKNARENFSNILKEPSTKELINQAISINDFNFSYLALTLLDPPMKSELLSRIDAFKYQNNQILFSPSLIKLNKHNILTSDNVEALTLYMNNYDLKINCPMIADCFIRLHQADLLNEVNRQLIINNPTLHITLVNALIKLKESDLVSDDITHQAIINKPYALEEIITGLIQLKEANLLNLLSDDNRRAFLNNPDQHQEIINGLKELREVPDLFSDASNRQAIINNPSHYKGIIAGLIELKAANLLNEDNRQLIIHNVVTSNPYYNCKNLIDDLRKLDEAKILSADTGELLKRAQSKYMVEAIVNLHNEKILDTFTKLLPTLTRGGIFSVAKGLFLLKQADILTEQSQNLIIENQEDAVEISRGLVSLKEHGVLNDDIPQLLSEKQNIREITGYLSSLIEEKTLNAENIKQVITCYDDLMRLKDDKVLTEENYNLLIQQNDLKLAVNGLNKLRDSGCHYDNHQEYIINCTRPGFAEMFDFLKDTGLLTEENIYKLIQQKDINLINTEIESLIEKGIINKENVVEFVTKMTQHTDFSTAINEYILGTNNKIETNENRQTTVQDPVGSVKQQFIEQPEPDLLRNGVENTVKKEAEGPLETKNVDTILTTKNFKQRNSEIINNGNPDLMLLKENLKPHMDLLKNKIMELRNEAEHGCFPFYKPDELAGRKADALEGLLNNLGNARSVATFENTLNDFALNHIDTIQDSKEVDINKGRGLFTQLTDMNTSSTKLIKNFQEAVHEAHEALHTSTAKHQR